MEQVKIEVSATPGCNDITLRTGEAKRVYYQQGTSYQLDTIDAIAELVKFRGKPETTLIFCDEKQIGIILDDSIMDRDKDLAKFDFCHSDEYGEWKAVLSKPLNQKSFVDFLKLREPEEVEGLDSLLGTIQFLSYATQIIGDFSYEDRDNTTVCIKIKDSETTAKIPQQFIVAVPLIYGSDKKVSMEIQLELQKPRSEDQRPVFVITCPKFNRYWNEAVKYETDRLKGLLPGYKIIAGSMG
jgi:hypothetical protein